MAIYHCNAKIVSRGKGRSAVGAAAYRSGEMIYNEYDGRIHDYTKKGGVVYSEIMLCVNAPQEYKNRSVLWNAVEKAEKQSTSQLAREIEISLPAELTREEQKKLVRNYTQDNFVNNGMCVDFSIHDKRGGNPHAHIMLTMRPIKENGEWGAKSKKVYLLNGKGEKIYDKNKRQYKCEKQTTTNWDSNEFLLNCREDWATKLNRELERKGLPDRVDYRSFADQEIDQIPTKHMGATATNMERRGIQTDRGNENREIAKINDEIKNLKIAALEIENEYRSIENTEEKQEAAEPGSKQIRNAQAESFNAGITADHNGTVNESSQNIEAKQQAFGNIDYKSLMAEFGMPKYLGKYDTATGKLVIDELMRRGVKCYGFINNDGKFLIAMDPAYSDLGIDISNKARIRAKQNIEPTVRRTFGNANFKTMEAEYGKPYKLGEDDSITGRLVIDELAKRGIKCSGLIVNGGKFLIVMDPAYSDLGNKISKDARNAAIEYIKGVAAPLVKAQRDYFNAKKDFYEYIRSGAPAGYVADKKYEAAANKLIKGIEKHEAIDLKIEGLEHQKKALGLLSFKQKSELSNKINEASIEQENIRDEIAAVTGADSSMPKEEFISKVKVDLKELIKRAENEEYFEYAAKCGDGVNERIEDAENRFKVFCAKIPPELTKKVLRAIWENQEPFLSMGDAAKLAKSDAEKLAYNNIKVPKEEPKQEQEQIRSREYGEMEYGAR